MKDILKSILFIGIAILFATNVMAQQPQYQQQGQYPQGQYPQQGQYQQQGQYPQGQYPQQGQYQQGQYPTTGAGQVQGYQQQGVQQRGYVTAPRYVVQTPPQAVDSGDGLFGIAKGKIIVVFKNVRNIVFILGGFGLIALAVLAIFGKPNWKWFGLLAVGLLVVALAGAIVEFLGGKNDLGNTIQTSQPQPQPVYQQPVYQQPAQPVYR